MPPGPSQRLDLLIGSTEPPDPFGNAAGRWYYVLAKGLTDRGHRVRWLSAFSKAASAQRAKSMLSSSRLDLRLYAYPQRSWLRRKVETIRRPYGYAISNDLAGDMEREQRRGYDVLHIEQTSAGWLGVGAPRTLLSVLWLARVDLAGRNALSMDDRLSRFLLTRVESRLLRQFNHIRLLTADDASVVRRMNPGARLSVAPLGLDPALYPFDPCGADDAVVGLVGSMNWRPTYMAATRLVTSIWPRVKARIPSARLVLAGWNAKKHLGPVCNADDGITIFENLPDVLPVLRAISVFAFPAPESSGMKIKILEAMAYGVPVVTTTAGMRGIDAQDGVHACIADDDEEFARKLCDLLKDQVSRRQMSRAARRLIEERYSPAPTLDRMEALYATTLNTSGQ
jgi:glycosyltransferase involved in cell wall biosynthesis